MQLGSIFSNPKDNLIRQFADFKKQMEGKNAEEIVKQLLKEGKMTNEQFESYKAQAQGLMSILR